MPEKKVTADTSKKAKKAPKQAAKRGDVMIVIGAKDQPEAAPGVQVWMLDGEELTKKGDRHSVACLTSQQLYELGWIRRKH
jgi:hypothetical protein